MQLLGGVHVYITADILDELTNCEFIQRAQLVFCSNILFREANPHGCTIETSPTGWRFNQLEIFTYFLKGLGSGSTAKVSCF